MLTKFVFYSYYPFSVSWTIRSPGRSAGACKALLSFSIQSNKFLYEAEGKDYPEWQMQIYQPDSACGTNFFPHITDIYVPMVDQPSRAQVLNLKRRRSVMKLAPMKRSLQIGDYSNQLVLFQESNKAVAALFEFGTATHPSADCAELVTLVFPEKKIVYPSGLTAQKLAKAASNQCYQDFMAEVRSTASICSKLWHKCGDPCVDKSNDGVVQINSNTKLVRDLLMKIIYLADAVYLLTTAPFSGKRSMQCGASLYYLFETFPGLKSCPMKDYLRTDSLLQHHEMNPPFYARKAGNCSATCLSEIDAFMSSYDCCTPMDIDALSAWSAFYCLFPSPSSLFLPCRHCVRCGTRNESSAA